MEIKQFKLEDLIPYINNPRKSLNVDKVASSILEFGFQQPIVVNKEKIILAGHTRYYAAKKLELNTVPCIVADLSNNKQKAFRIADNRVAEDNKWDIPLLTIEIEDLKNSNFNIDSLGFNIDDLENLFIDENFEPDSIENQSNLDTETEGICSKCGQKLQTKKIIH